ncbi:MAG: polyprenyl synthetase family protein [Candidatus Micrarchaeota archaeon]|nr:polyprenyl synthetase family protein [Candidatus Micrarchaeota archaeon]
MLEIERKIEELNRPVKRRLQELFAPGKKPFEVYGLLSEFMAKPGKLLRPALCLASCQAVGGRREDAVSAAAAIEMFHNFTLIHDDIEDNSLLRRGKPCLHIKYSLPLALNAGDGLFMLVWKEALSIPGPRREEAQRRLLSGFTQVLEGQAIELGWYFKGKWDVAESDYRTVVEGKTGALISCACEVGGMLGGGDRAACRALSEFGMGIGVGFQIMDDVLNLSGDQKKYGKEIGGDIAEGKRTLITIRALQALEGRKRERLGFILKKSKKSKRDVKEALLLIKESGVMESVVNAAEEEISRAISKLDALPRNSQKLLREIAEYITKRER